MASHLRWKTTKEYKESIELTWDIVSFAAYLDKNHIYDNDTPADVSQNFTLPLLGPVNASASVFRKDTMLRLRQSLSFEKAVYEPWVLNPEVYLLGHDEEVCFAKCFLSSSLLNNDCGNGSVLVVPFEEDIILLDELWADEELYFADGTLRIRLSLSFSLDDSVDNSNSAQSDNNCKEEVVNNLIAAYAKQRKDEETADIKFVCASEKSVSFFAHKGALTARSRVFDRMFRAEWKESKTNVVKIEDFEVPIFPAFLDFIYTAKLPSDDADADQLGGLAMAADKYELIDLKDYCLEQLMRKLNYKNFGRVAMAFHLCSHEKKNQELFWDFCSRNWLELRHEPEFVQLTRDYPDAFFPPTPPKVKEEKEQ